MNDIFFKPNVFARVVAVLFLILLAALLFEYFFDPRSRIPEPGHAESNIITLTTATVPYMPPHEHTLGGDSIFDLGHGFYTKSSTLTIDRDEWVTGVQLVIANAPKAVLHHLNVYIIDGTPNPVCPGFPRKEMISLGQDTPDGFDIATPYGIFLKKGTEIQVNAMFHNAHPPEGPGGTYKNVSAGIKLRVVQNDPTRTVPLEFYRLIIDEPPHCIKGEEVGVFTVPAHTIGFTKTSDEITDIGHAQFTFQEPGVISVMGAHMHPLEGGREVDVFLNGKQIESYIPKHSSTNEWDWVTHSTFTFIHVNAGDKLTMSVKYDNPTDEPILDAMGMVGFYFSPEPDFQSSVESLIHALGLSKTPGVPISDSQAD